MTAAEGVRGVRGIKGLKVWLVPSFCRLTGAVFWFVDAGECLARCAAVCWERDAQLFVRDSQGDVGEDGAGDGRGS